MLTYYQLDPYNPISIKFDGKYKHFHSKRILEIVLGKMGTSRMCMHIYVYIYMCECIYTYVCICVTVYVCIYMCVYI